ncbi:MAG: hypothetical protein Q9222_001565 [Ikaeria aurantiellina]
MSDLLAQLRSVQNAAAGHEAAQMDAATRSEAVRLTQNIMVELEDPGDLIDRLCYQPAENILIRVAVDIGLFEALNKSSAPPTAEMLAGETNTEITLLERILRGLVAMNAIEEVGEDGYGPTKVSKAFTTDKGTSMARVFVDVLHPTWYKLPEILVSTKYQNPTDPKHNGTQLAFNTDENLFGWLAKNPEALWSFGVFMATQATGRPNFLDIYPAAEQLVKGFKSEQNTEDVMLVDVGGATGEEALEFGRRHPTAPGRLIVQDRASVIGQLPETEGLEKMVYDFFTPQPIRGARAYYFRRIFHDWNDDLSTVMLRNTAMAMAPGYSKMLINELVVPRRGASSFATNQDMNVMSVLSGVERTEQQWQELLPAVGLKILKIWTPEGATESIIEAMLE